MHSSLKIKQDIKVFFQLTSMLFSFLCFNVVISYAQPVADFSVNKQQGCTPLLVQISDQSSGNVTSWDWTFSNGGSSTQQNPSLALVNPGQYDIKLVVAGPNGKDSVTKTALITVFKNPTADFSTNSTTSGCAPLTVAFDDQSSLGDAAITSWLWDFGDGTTSAQQNPTHSFTTGGQKNVSLEVIDANGCSAIELKKQFANVTASPEATFTATNRFACEAPLKVNFQSVATGANLTHEWIFGDGSTSSQENPQHTYSQNGTYDVIHIVTDPNGCTDTVELEDYVSAAPFNTKIGVSSTEGCTKPIKTQFQFTNNSGPNARFQFWNFDDGSTSFQQNPGHTFDTAGIYTVRLISGNAGCSDTDYIDISVQQIEAGFEVDSELVCYTPFEANFTDTSFNAVDHLWDFGDSSQSLVKNPSNIYNTEDSFKVFLVVRNSVGCIDTSDTTTIYVDTLDPQIGTGQFARGGCAPHEVNFIDKTESLDPIVQWNWDFGNGNTSSNPSSNQVYNDTGFFNVTLTVTSSIGCVDSVSEFIEVGNEPEVEFSASEDTVCAGEPFGLNINRINGIADSLVFDMGDGSPPLVNANGFEYRRDTGEFIISLEYYHNRCKANELLYDTVYVNGPIARFEPLVNCDTTHSVVHKNTSTDADSIHWTFFDGTESTLQNPRKLYPDTGGEYKVVIESYNFTTGCTFIDSGIVQIFKVKALFTMSDNAGCKPVENIQFDASASEDVFNLKYFWKFGNGNFANEFTTNVLQELITPEPQSYDSSGKFKVTLTVQDLFKCEDSISKYIQVYRHETDIQLSDSGGCVPLSVDMQSDVNAQFPINSYNWDFGDGSQSVTQNPQHNYTTKGEFVLKLITEDSKGCTDSAEKIIDVNDPVADFLASDRDVCKFDSIRFYTSLFNLGYTFDWDFGDGTTADDVEPTHRYQEKGVYTVKLKIEDQFGCSDSITKLSHVEVTGPEAAFSGSDSSAFCPPLLVDFTSQSIGKIQTWEWDFGNRSTSGLENPQHNYTEAGIFDVSLRVIDSNGCYDSIIKPKHIEIGGPEVEYLIEPDTGCRPLKVEFFAFNKKDVATIVWDFADGNSAPGDTVTHTYTDYGEFYPNIILSNGKSGNLLCEYGLKVKDPIVIDTADADFRLSSGINACLDVPVQIADNSKGNIVRKFWDLGRSLSDTFTTLPSDPQTYTDSSKYTLSLAIESSFGCKDTMIKEIEVHAAPWLTVAQGGFICEYDNWPLLAKSESGSSFLWEPADGLNDPNIRNPLASPSLTTEYVVTATDTNGCENSSKPVIVTVQPKPEITALTDTTIIDGDSASISYISDYPLKDIKWIGADFINCDTCAPTSVFPDNTRDYIIQGTDTADCFTVRDTLTIVVDKSRSLDVPEVFTPNGDNINEVIYPDGWGIKELVFFRIYNRWGEMVFEGSSMDEGWNGFYQGNLQNTDTYVYHAKAITLAGDEIEKKGSFSLVR